MTLSPNAFPAPTFSGHQTFVFRYPWLKKGVDALSIDPGVFRADDAIVRLGVGKNMVDSIRYWGLSTGVIEEAGGTGEGRIMMNPDTLALYFNAFAKLRRKVDKLHGQAPHKPILLLALLDEIELGAFPDGLITITPELIAGFHTYWGALVSSTHWGATMHNPFRHLYQEGWWNFIKDGESVAPLEITPSLKYMAENYDGVRLAPELWQLLQDRVALNVLRNHLLQTYFGKKDASEVVRESPENYLYAEVEKLKAEAQRPFKTRVVERTEEVYFMRHTLFPKVIRALYGDSCAVCGLSVHLTGANAGAILDGAHIVPFHLWHNDDPRNGISLCKNHHWGFDRGWFSVSDDYRVLVSPRVANAPGYLTENVALRLPVAPILHPAPDALKWHRENVWRR